MHTDIYEGINKDYQPRTNLVKNKKGDLLADSSILSMWNSNFSQVLNVHLITDVRQKYIQLSH
jgi:hypothetical protein